MKFNDYVKTKEFRCGENPFAKRHRILGKEYKPKSVGMFLEWI